MLFNSLPFLLFFIIVTTVYYLLPNRFRWVHLLAASCYFYMAFIPVYIFILGGTIIIDYFAGLIIEKSVGKRRKFWLVVSLITNIGVLAVFKYYNFFTENANHFLEWIHIPVSLTYLKIILPIGLSFHTFQAMSYTIEVYRGNQVAERHFGIYALYVMFYPQLVAGPIERPQHMLHQFHEKHPFIADNLFIGIKMILWGLFKKVVIADRLAILVNQVYDSPHAYNSTTLFIATLFFSVQIYCDFSGYSTIAIGTARAMGFKLMTNFNKPYESRSISEFWKRWHISLSSWFKDYLYISLGGNRVSIPRWYLNLFIVFLLSGLWHGANWTFIVWGGLHGCFQVFGLMTRKQFHNISVKTGLINLHKLTRIWSITFTFLLVTLSWVFFRSHNVGDAVFILKKIFTREWGGFQDSVLFTKMSLALSFGLIFLLFFVEARNWDQIVNAPLPEKRRSSLAFGILVLSAILLFGIFEKLSFIYFQF